MWDSPTPDSDVLPLLYVSLDGDTWTDVNSDPQVTVLNWNLTYMPYSVTFETYHLSDWVIGDGDDDPMPAPPVFRDWMETKGWRRSHGAGSERYRA